MAEIRMLQEQQQQLQGLVGTRQETRKPGTTKLDAKPTATRKAMADQTLATTNIGDNVRMLREKTDETNVRISTMAQELEALRQTVASQPGLPAVTTPPVTGAPAPAGGGAQPVPPLSSSVPAGVSPQRMYETSYDDYTAGRFPIAIDCFRMFVPQFSRLPQAANAVYNIGMSYYNVNKWNEAREAFLKVINEYPDAQGTTLPDAYYKLGQTYERLNQVENAKKAYEAAVQKFPGNPSTLSGQALQRLSRR